ncbi:hypothetical protein Lal_00027291 [Lupinus albus]|nr:hypothetical protein Lal_00027291 [Lupinus albus]
MSRPMRTKSVADKSHPPPKKHKSDTSGQVTPSFNRNKFTSLERDERCKVIRYDRDYLNMMLNNPYEVGDSHLDGYHLIMKKRSTMTHGFNIAETVETICLPGRTVSGNVVGWPKQIYRKDMSTLAHIWMIFCLHNVIPNSHVSSLPLFDCYLLYYILAGVEMDVSRLMATEIYKAAVKGGNKGTMGFPSLITSLCARQGVQVSATELIKKPITKKASPTFPGGIGADCVIDYQDCVIDYQDCVIDYQDCVIDYTMSDAQARQLSLRRESSSIVQDFTLPGAAGPSGLGDEDTATDEE